MVANSERMPTMADIATAAGVSRALVSIVLRDVAGASDETRARVRRVADELGYRPNAAAQVLRRARSGNVGVLFSPQYPFEVEIVEAMYPAASEHDYRLVLGAMTPHRLLDRAVDELLSYRCEALVIVGLDHADRWFDSLQSRVPVVRVGRPPSKAAVDVVHTHEGRGVDAALAHLVELGHRSIVFVDGGTLPGARERRRGYTAGMRRRGLSENVRVIPGDYTDQGGARAALALLASDELPTAVLCGNDWSAVGMLTTLVRHGVCVPDDVSVVGYDDSLLAQRSYLDLTSVQQDTSLMASAAMAAVSLRLDSADTQPVVTVVEPRLVIRSSTATPRSPG
jgi:DNA-binding LacI/PurR family transcriptional regulator